MYFKNNVQKWFFTLSGAQFCGAYGLRRLSQLQHEVNGDPEAVGWLTGDQTFQLEPFDSVNILGFFYPTGLVQGKLKYQTKILRFLRLSMFSISNALIDSLLQIIASEVSYEITAIPTKS